MTNKTTTTMPNGFQRDVEGAVAIGTRLISAYSALSDAHKRFKDVANMLSDKGYILNMEAFRVGFPLSWTEKVSVWEKYDRASRLEAFFHVMQWSKERVKIGQLPHLNGSYLSFTDSDIDWSSSECVQIMEDLRHSIEIGLLHPYCHKVLGFGYVYELENNKDTGEIRKMCFLSANSIRQHLHLKQVNVSGIEIPEDKVHEFLDNGELWSNE